MYSRPSTLRKHQVFPSSISRLLALPSNKARLSFYCGVLSWWLHKSGICSYRIRVWPIYASLRGNCHSALLPLQVHMFTTDFTGSTLNVAFIIVSCSGILRHKVQIYFRLPEVWAPSCANCLDAIFSTTSRLYRCTTVSFVYSYWSSFLLSNIAYACGPTLLFIFPIILTFSRPLRSSLRMSILNTPSVDIRIPMAWYTWYINIM